MSHLYHACGCELTVPPRMLMCRKHWRMVPRDLQRSVWRHYVPGQERRKDPAQEYLEAAQAAIVAVFVKDQNSKTPRPYARCQECGAEFIGSRSHPFCTECGDGQTYMFETRPEGFEPVVNRKTPKETQ